jgi:uncharacterized protein
MQATLIDPKTFRRTPWKNGGGTTIDIADEFRAGATHSDWDAMIWRFGRTAITTPAPFSDLTGFDRMQVLVSGRGLVLRSPDSEIDVRRPFHPVRFDGGTPIVSDLEAGPVEVVNLMSDSRLTDIDLRAPQPNAMLDMPAGIHILYAPDAACTFALDGAPHAIERGWALRLDAAAPGRLHAHSGQLVVGSVYLRA